MKHEFNDLNLWFTTRRGRRIAKRIAAVLENVLPLIPGQHCLQLGILEHSDWLGASPIAHQSFVTPYSTNVKKTVCASLYELPVATESVSLAFAPFCLELLDHAQSFLLEMSRCVAPGGHMLFLGVNPCSMWGLPRLFRKESQFSIWQSHLFSAFKLRRYLNDMSLSIQQVERFYFSPPFVESERLMDVFDQIGKMILPFPAGFYLLLAKKTDLMPVKPLWHQQQYVVGKPTVVS